MKVLVVEDEEMIARLYEDILTTFGYDVLLAKDGQQGIDMYDVHFMDIDFVLLDLTLPFISGYDVCSHIRQMNADVKIILTSGYSPKTIFAKLDSSKINAFLQKPFAPNHLLEILSKVDDAAEPLFVQ